MFATWNRVKKINRDLRKQNIQTVQDTIPIQDVFSDGIFKLKSNLYTQTFSFSNLNFAVLNDEGKENKLKQYCTVLNSIDTSYITQIHVISRKMEQEQWDQFLFDEEKEDEFQVFRNELNQCIDGYLEHSNGIIQNLYMTLSVQKNSVKEARAHFDRLSSKIGTRLIEMHSFLKKLTLRERLRIFYDFNVGDRYFNFDEDELKKQGHSIKNVISPMYMKVEKTYFELENRYGRSMYLKDYPSYIPDNIIHELCTLPQNMAVTVSFVPIPKSEAVKEGELKHLGIETNIANWQDKQNRNNNFNAIIPFKKQQEREATNEFLEDMTQRDQKMMIGSVTAVLLSNTKEQLEIDTDMIKSLAEENRATLATLTLQQLEGLQSTLPYGMSIIPETQTLTTETVAAFSPFSTQRICYPRGIVMGKNALSGDVIAVDRRELINGNGFVLGLSGSGKSMLVKYELFNWYLRYRQNAEFIIVDPDGDWKNTTDALGGVSMDICTGSRSYINVMELDPDYADEGDPIAEKCSYMIDFMKRIYARSEQIITAGEESIFDRCCQKLYKDLEKRNYQGEQPTLRDLRELLLQVENGAGEHMALVLEKWTEGSLSMFSKQTSIDTANNVIRFNLHRMEENLQSIGMHVMMDNIWNRVLRNHRKGKLTYIVFDEIYRLFQDNDTNQALMNIWKRIRKFGGFLTGITQNAGDLLQSHQAQTMLSNSEYLVLMNQKDVEARMLADLLHMSNKEMIYLLSAGVGKGLIRCGQNMLQFENYIPSDTELYRMTHTDLKRNEERKTSGAQVQKAPVYQRRFRPRSKLPTGGGETYSKLT